MNKNEKGITLIALIITITIMLILVSVSVDIAIDGRLFDSAKSTVQTTNNKVGDMQNEVNALLDEWDRLNVNQIPTQPPLEPPTITEFTVSSYDTTTISVSTKVIDNVTGIKSYKFQYKEAAEATYKTAATTETSNSICTYQYTGLKDETTYNLRVVVTDKENNQITSGVLTQETKTARVPKVGDYVNYTPDTETYKVESDATGYTGADAPNPQTFTTEAGLQWRILSIDEANKEIELIAATQTTSLIYLNGAPGYNHGVDILNDLCKDLYSNSSIKAVARSIKIEDIQAKTTYKTSNDSNYGATYQMSTMSFGNAHPNLYKKELGSTSEGINATGLKTASEGLDNRTFSGDVSKYTDATVDANNGYATADLNMYATRTHLSYYPDNYLRTDLGVNNPVTGIFNTTTTYWVASRCVGTGAGSANFFLHCVKPNPGLNADYLFNSNRTPVSYGSAVKPVVSIPYVDQLTKDDTKSTESVTYWNI